MQVNSPNLHRRQDEQVTKEEPKHKKLDTRFKSTRKQSKTLIRKSYKENKAERECLIAYRHKQLDLANGSFGSG